MPIEKRKCQCGCGRTFLGTAQRKFYNGNCKQKAYRKRKKNIAELNRDSER